MTNAVRQREHSPTRHASVLHAEDDRLTSAAVARLLTVKGFKVETATNGQEALRKLLSPPAAYDFIITDEAMPLLTGEESLRRDREGGLSGRRWEHASHSLQSTGDNPCLRIGYARSADGCCAIPDAFSTGYLFMSRWRSPQIAAKCAARAGREAEQKRREKLTAWLIVIGLVVFWGSFGSADYFWLRHQARERHEQRYHRGGKTNAPASAVPLDGSHQGTNHE